MTCYAHFLEAKQRRALPIGRASVSAELYVTELTHTLFAALEGST